MSRRPFFVGVGAQRSGTTWLAHFLRELPDVRFSPLKEMNFFDSLFIEDRRDVMKRPLQTRLAVLGLGRYGLSAPLSAIRLSRHYLGVRKKNETAYGAFMRELGRNGQVAGEITPAYAGLPEAGIALMDQILDEPNVFLSLRNPVDRLVSQYSFRKVRRGVEPVAEGRDIGETLEMLARENIYSAYGDCLARYRKLIPLGRFHVLFYERLFDPSCNQSVCDELCEFLGIRSAPARLNKEVNRAPGVEIDAGVRKRLVDTLAGEYGAVAEAFPNDLPESWERDLGLLDAR